MRRRLGMAFAAILGVIAVLAFALTRTSVSFEPPQREGPVALVAHDGAKSLWVLVKQEERQLLGTGGGRFNTVRYRRKTRYHFELQAFDPDTGTRVWQRRLRTVPGERGGSSARARILGQDGASVWLFVHDGPVAVSARDGAAQADRSRLEEVNPALRGKIATEPGFLAFAGALIVTTADAHTVRVAPGTWRATPYTPPDPDAFRRAQFLADQWNGGYRTADFVTRLGRIDGRWVGLYTDREAAFAVDDGFGENLRDPSRVIDDGARARRALRVARLGKTRAFREGRHDRLVDLPRQKGDDYLQAGFLVKAGSKTPRPMTDPTGALIVHRTRADEKGRLAITRLDPGLRPLWTTPLPIGELANRWDLGKGLLLYGSADETVNGTRHTSEFVVRLDLATGAAQAWNVTAQAPVADGPP